MDDVVPQAQAPQVDLMELVSAMPVPVAVLSADLRATATNAAFDAVAARLGWDPEAGATGKAGDWPAVAAAAAAVLRDGASCELVARDVQGSSWRVHVSRLSARRKGGPQLLLLLQGQPASAADRLRHYARRHGLTPTETSVVAALLDGQRPQQIATQNGVSIHTVRAQIASALSKSGCRCQGQLIAEVLGGGLTAAGVAVSGAPSNVVPAAGQRRSEPANSLMARTGRTRSELHLS